MLRRRVDLPGLTRRDGRARDTTLRLELSPSVSIDTGTKVEKQTSTGILLPSGGCGLNR